MTEYEKFEAGGVGAAVLVTHPETGEGTSAVIAKLFPESQTVEFARGPGLAERFQIAFHEVAPPEPPAPAEATS
jgi:hypothetical protein